MNLWDLLEALVEGDWSRTWVLTRRWAVRFLALFFPSVLVTLMVWYAHWKAGGLIHDFQHFVTPPTPRP